MDIEPLTLAAALATFDELWSPRIVTRVNDYDVRVAKVAGTHLWHAHDDTDEFFLVLEGVLEIGLRSGSGLGEEVRHDGHKRSADSRTVRLERGSVFVVPRGIEHRPSSSRGASILMFERSGTRTVGDRHEEVPAHVADGTGTEL